MTGFCVEKVHCDESLRPRHGLLRIDALRVASDARVTARRLLAKARDDADLLLGQARTDAQCLTEEAQADKERIAQEAQAEAQRLTQEAEQKTLQRADQMLKTLEQANATYLHRAHDVVVDMVQGLFDRLVAEMTPRERIEAAVRRVLQEAPSRLVTPTLRVHPDDIALLPEVEWEVKPDASLSVGTCRLEATDGQWCVDFNAAVTALKSAFARAVEQPAVEDGKDDE